jgi:hypothetical protein
VTTDGRLGNTSAVFAIFLYVDVGVGARHRHQHEEACNNGSETLIRGNAVMLHHFHGALQNTDLDFGTGRGYLLVDDGLQHYIQTPNNPTPTLHNPTLTSTATLYLLSPNVTYRRVHEHAFM